jgi:NADH dehydrogenase (ubiquinone) 1 alpha subcomplex subunit 9
MWRRQYRAMPLWKKGEETIKQPVFVSDVAAGIVAAVRDPYVAGKEFCAVGSVFFSQFTYIFNFLILI